MDVRVGLWRKLSSKELMLLNCGVFSFSSVQFSRSVMSDSLQRHEPQHTRPPCPSPTPGTCSNSCPSSRWCHPTISSCLSLLLLLSIFPSIKVFSSEPVLCIRWPKYWNFSFSISPSSEYSGLISFRMTSLIVLQSRGVFSNTTVQKHQFLGAQLYGPTLTSIHDYWKNHSFN